MANTENRRALIDKAIPILIDYLHQGLSLKESAPLLNEKLGQVIPYGTLSSWVTRYPALRQASMEGKSSRKSIYEGLNGVKIDDKGISDTDILPGFERAVKVHLDRLERLFGSVASAPDDERLDCRNIEQVTHLMMQRAMEVVTSRDSSIDQVSTAQKVYAAALQIREYAEKDKSSGNQIEFNFGSDPNSLDGSHDQAKKFLKIEDGKRENDDPEPVETDYLILETE